VRESGGKSRLIPILRPYEPIGSTAGVDFELRMELWRYIRRLHGQGTTILLTTHYLEEAEELCEDIALIRDGRLVAQDIEVIMDGGAYSTLTPVVLSRGALHAGGPYRCPNVRIRARATRTNTPPNGAFRGFGAPQTEFAAEVQLSRVAERLGLSPAEVRARNVYRLGDTTPTGQVLRESVAAEEVLRLAVDTSGFEQLRDETAKELGQSLEYSYGYEVIDSSNFPADLKPFPGARRILKSVDVFEVSGVLRGAAGPGASGTDWIKSAPAASVDAELEEIGDHVALSLMAESFKNLDLVADFNATMARTDALLYSHWKEVPAGSVAAIARKFADEVLLQVSVELGTASPQIRWFTAADSDGDFKTIGPCAGLVKDSDTIWIRSDLRGADLAQTIAHETFHVKQRRQGSPDVDEETRPMEFGLQVRRRFERSY